MKKESKKKKSILSDIPAVEEEVEKVIPPVSTTEEDIFTIKPIKDHDPDPEEEVTPEEVPEVVPEVAPVKKKSLKSIRSPAQIESLKRGREMRVARIRAEKEKLGIVTKKPPVQPSTPTPQAPQQIPVNHKSNNDFETFLENYQKMKKFETFVLEKNSRKQKQAAQPAPVQQKPVPAPVPAQPQKLDYAFNLSRTSRRRGFY